MCKYFPEKQLLTLMKRGWNRNHPTRMLLIHLEQRVFGPSPNANTDMIINAINFLMFLLVLMNEWGKTICFILISQYPIWGEMG